MTVRGGGVPLTPHGSTAGKKNGSAASELAADAYPCIMVWVFDPPHTRMWHDASCTNPQLPSNAVIPDSLKCAVVLEAVQGHAPAGWRYAPSLTASARAGISAPRSGRGKACGADRTREMPWRKRAPAETALHERERLPGLAKKDRRRILIGPVGHPLDKKRPIQGWAKPNFNRAKCVQWLPTSGLYLLAQWSNDHFGR